MFTFKFKGYSAHAHILNSGGRPTHTHEVQICNAGSNLCLSSQFSCDSGLIFTSSIGVNVRRFQEKTGMSFNSSGPGAGAGGQNAVDPEMQAFIEAEAGKAKIQQQIHKLNNLCWDTCVDKPRDKLDSRTESCMCNCVERYVDVAKLIEQRFQQRVQKAASGGF